MVLPDAASSPVVSRNSNWPVRDLVTEPMKMHEGTPMSSASPILPYLVADLDSPPPFVDRTYGEPLFHTDSDVAALQYAADGTLWSVEESGVLRQWSNEGHLITRIFLSDLETLWSFNADATLLTSGSDDLAVWDTQSGKV